MPFKFLFSDCECNLEGSESRQCNKKDGSCICLPGVMGYRCDKCTRGWRGEVPNCQPCGECFNNWDEILGDLKSKFRLNGYWMSIGLTDLTLLYRGNSGHNR